MTTQDFSGSLAGHQFGKYKIIAQLATGGMAEIYLASQNSLAGFEKLIVIKRILPNLAKEPKFIEMFLDEARIAAMVNHPNVVHIYDLGRIQGQYFIAMEYLAGESLSSMVKACRKRATVIPKELAVGMTMQAAEGLGAAHTTVGSDGKALNIVHRDVSPQNIFVLYDGGVKVVDFGIAKAAMRSTETRTGTLKGKYRYMSPEQITSQELDGRSDVFALGVVLWECLTGCKLFHHDSDLALLKSITEEDAPSPQQVLPDLDDELCAITLKALARDRDERYASAAEFRKALAHYIKVNQAEADTVAIGTFAQDLFADRIKRKRAAIEGAQAAATDLNDDFLFGDINHYLSDTEHSIPSKPLDTIASTAQVQKPAGQQKRTNWLPAVLGVFGLMAAIGMGLFILLDGDKTEPEKGSPDAGLITPAGAPDGGLTQVDAGLKEPAALTDGGPAPADKQVKKPVTGHKKKKKKRTRRKRIKKPNPAKVAKQPDPKPAIVPEPKTEPKPGPPGTLRLMTSPWTEIYYKGKKLGQTPLVDVQLPSGIIKLKAINKEEGIEKTITIKIEPGKRTSKRFNFF